MTKPKWTPANPGQVLNFVLFYLLTTYFFGFLDVLGLRIFKVFMDTFSLALLPLIVYSIGYTLIVRFFLRRKPAPEPTN